MGPPCRDRDRHRDRHRGRDQHRCCAPAGTGRGPKLNGAAVACSRGCAAPGAGFMRSLRPRRSSPGSASPHATCRFSPGLCPAESSRRCGASPRHPQHPRRRRGHGKSPAPLERLPHLFCHRFCRGQGWGRGAPRGGAGNGPGPGGCGTRPAPAPREAQAGGAPGAVERSIPAPRCGNLRGYDDYFIIHLKYFKQGGYLNDNRGVVLELFC